MQRTFLIQYFDGENKCRQTVLSADDPVEAARRVTEFFAEDGDEDAFITGVFERVELWGVYQ